VASPRKKSPRSRRKSPAPDAGAATNLCATRGPVTAQLAVDEPFLANGVGASGATRPLSFYVVDDDPNAVEMMATLIAQARASGQIHHIQPDRAGRYPGAKTGRGDHRPDEARRRSC
jgi:capsid protein